MIRLINFLTFLVFILFYNCKSITPPLTIPTEDLEYLLSGEQAGQISKNQLVAYWDNNDTANAFIQYDVTVYRITYKSIDLDGKENTLSGAILVPDMTGVKSVVSVQHATFFAEQEAPSVNDGFSVVSRKSIFAAHGYIVFLPDYHGYGVDQASIHPYHHAESLQTASRDMLFAGYEFLQSQQIDFNQQLFLAGYSEGAYATAALQQALEKRTDLPFSLTATSLGSGAYNLKATFEYFTADITQSFGCTPCNAFLLQSFNEVYTIGHPLTHYFQSPYANLIEEGLFLGAYDAAGIAQQLPADAAQLFNPVFILNYYNGAETAWENALDINSIHQWQPNHPTLVTHNLEDNVAPFFNSEAFAQNNQANPNLEFYPVPQTDHFSGILQWGILTLDYFDKF